MTTKKNKQKNPKTLVEKENRLVVVRGGDWEEEKLEEDGQTSSYKINKY